MKSIKINFMLPTLCHTRIFHSGVPFFSLFLYLIIESGRDNIDQLLLFDMNASVLMCYPL